MDKLQIIEEERGCLIPFCISIVPFDVKRIFFINNVPIGENRGNHSHKENKQFLICLSGSVDVEINNGNESKIYDLRKGNYIMIDKLIWSHQYYTDETTSIMVLCSHEYDKEDYITDFEEFKRLTNG